MIFNKVLTGLLVAGVIIPLVACIVLQYQRWDIHPLRQVTRMLRRPWCETALLVFFIGGMVQYGTSKGILGGSPAMMGSPLSSVQLMMVTGADATTVPLFPAYTNTVTNLCLAGILPASTSVYLKSMWPTNMTIPGNALEVYARHDLVTNVWGGVGTAPIVASEGCAVVELPYSYLPMGWESSMFFTLGLCTDSDNDGLSDAFERFVSQTDPCLADTDGDGMPDGWEYGMGLNPCSDTDKDGALADRDGDGFSNIEEYYYGTNPFWLDTDGDKLGDRMEIGQVEELRGENFLWLETMGHTSLLDTREVSDIVRSKIPLPYGMEINGVCYTNAQVDLDGLVVLIHPDKQSARVPDGVGTSSDGMSNVVWSLNHVTVAACNGDLCAKPRASAWNSAFTYGTVATNGAHYTVVEYRNVSHYDLKDSAPASLMSFQVILPDNETNVVYVSYQNVDDAIFSVNRGYNFGVQLPATNCVPGRGLYANVSWDRHAGCFDEPLTLKYTLGTGTNPSARDIDGDTLDDFAEVFVHHSDPYRADTDGDGLDDGREVDLGTDLHLTDTDGDGMDDGWETKYGTYPLVDDAAADPDWDGLPNIWERYNGTDPRSEDTDGDMLTDGCECGWVEDGITNIPWFTVQPILTYAPTADADKALIGCAMPFTNRLAGCLIDTALADVNGVVYFGRSDATNSLYSLDNGPNLSEKQNKLVATVAAYWSDLKARTTLGSSIIFGTVAQNATNRFFVIEYRDVGTYSGNDNRISLQMSIPENEPNLVYVRYGTITDARTNYSVSIGAQGAKVGSYANTPLLNHYYENKPPILAAGRTLAFHFGAGSDPLVADTDEDGLDDRVEHIIGTNPRNTDTDGDGFDDQEEIEYGMSPVSAVGADGADGDFDGDGLANAQEAKFGTLLNVADCDGDGIPDGEETGYIAVSNDLPWLTFDRYEDCTTDLVYQTHSQYHVNRGLPCALTIQGELVTNITFTSQGWLFLNKAGLGDKWRGNTCHSFTSKIDGDTLAIAAYGYSMSVLTNAAERSTVVRYGTATHDGVGYVVIEYDNIYHQLASSATNSISFQIALPTNTADRVCIRYRDVTGTYMDGRNCGIGMQTFGGKWLHSYCYSKVGKVYEGLGLQFLFGRNTDPLASDSDGDGVADGEEIELGMSPCIADTDGDGLPDGWERDYELVPLSANGEDGACGDADGDGLPNGKEYEYGTNPILADTDGDGLADGQEVVDTFEDPTIPWVALAAPTDLTDAFSNEWECVDYAPESPLRVQGETVTNITLDAHGVIYLNRAGYANMRSAGSGWSLDYEIDENCAVIAPYWSDLNLDDVIGPSSIRVGLASVGTNTCLVIEYANMYYRSYWEDETNAISFQVAIPTGRVGRISVKYANPVGERMDGSNAEIGFQTFGFRNYSEYCDYDDDSVADGTGLVFLMGYGTDPTRMDTDRDGLTDGNEVNVHGCDPCSTDTDEDGLSDGDEIDLGTLPAKADSDDDGLSDAWEICHELNPRVAADEDGANGDPDSDGLTNIQELTLGGNPRNPDTDGDGLDDGREASLGTGVTIVDTDGDGLPDGDEDTRGTNPNAVDSDGDGLSDGWEVANIFNPLTPSGTTGEASADTDGDGLTNLQEMQNGTNPRLTDTDGDGISDSVEVNTLGTSPLRTDTDRDGLPDSQEQTLGLNPCQPDSDGDGMNDGWEHNYSSYGFDPATANADDTQSKTGPHDDLDGDGLTNAEECSFGTNPGVRDSDGDGVSDYDEVTNSSDPSDGSDKGERNSRWPVQFYFGDPSTSHSEKYRLEITPEEGPSGDATPTCYNWLNEGYGQCETKTAMIKPGWKYAVRLCHAATDPEYDGYPCPDYDYELSCTTTNGMLLVDDQQGLFGNNKNSGYSFTGEGKTAYVFVVRIEHDLLWETDNGCNRIRNDTPKDDSSGNFDCEEIMLGGKKCSFAAHRNFLYLTSSTDNKFKVTERIKVDSGSRTIFNKYADKFICAVFRNGEVVGDSQTRISASNLEAAIEFDGSDNEVAEELQLRVGIDADGDGELGCDESSPLEVCKINGQAAYATLKAISKSKYEKHRDAIRSKVYFAGDNPPACIAPHARSFLKLFYEPDSTGTITPSLRPTNVGAMQFDAFSSDTSCFAEWLTHNCGASYSESGLATIRKYSWNDVSAVSLFMSQRTPFALKTSMTAGGSYCECLTVTGRKLLDFYNSHVKSSATEALQDAEDGAEVTMPLNGGWYDQSALENSGVLTSLSPSWVPGMTLNVGSSSDYGGYDALFVQLMTTSPAFEDFDAFGTIGRGRVLNPRYRFVVKKVVPWIGMTRYEVVSVQFACAIEDLYDFNYEDGDLPANAAALQIGFRETGRNSGKIYSHHIDISTTYTNPFSLIVRQFPGG